MVSVIGRSCFCAIIVCGCIHVIIVCSSIHLLSTVYCLLSILQWCWPHVSKEMPQHTITVGSCIHVIIVGSRIHIIFVGSCVHLLSTLFMVYHALQVDREYFGRINDTRFYIVYLAQDTVLQVWCQTWLWHPSLPPSLPQPFKITVTNPASLVVLTLLRLMASMGWKNIGNGWNLLSLSKKYGCCCIDANGGVDSIKICQWPAKVVDMVLMLLDGSVGDTGW